MAENLPVNFAIPSESSIASYNWTDIAEGTGVRVIQGFNTETASGKLHHLSAYATESNNVETRLTTGDDTLTFNMSVFNHPQRIGGTGIIQFAGRFETGVGGSMSVFVAKLYKVSTATTELCSVSLPLAGSDATRRYVAPLTIPATHFKKGDYLRLTINVKYNAGAFTIGHDPANKDGTYITPASTYSTKFELLIPFKLDL
ncbi:MAG: hypothetical protein WC499_04330 [Patescibacteria group bacterium]